MFDLVVLINYLTYSVAIGRETGSLDDVQLMALKEFLPTDEERKGLAAYMERNASSEEEKAAAYAGFSECEKYMFSLMEVSEVAKKFDCMIYRVQFRPRFDELLKTVRIVETACVEVRSSERLRKIMAIILTLVNQINTGGDGNEAVGFGLDSLLKLNAVSLDC